MAELVFGWDKAVADARKVLGGDAKIPKAKGTINKAIEGEDKVYAEFDKARNELEDKVLALIDATSTIVDAVEQYRDVIAEASFGLNPKRDAKIIAAARKPLLTPLDAKIVRLKENAKNERELNKHLANIRDYKQGS